MSFKEPVSTSDVLAPDLSQYHVSRFTRFLPTSVRFVLLFVPSLGRFSSIASKMIVSSCGVLENPQALNHSTTILSSCYATSFR